MATTQIISDKKRGLRQIAEEILNKANKKEGSVVLSLYGDLGSGKTAFTQEIAKILGVKEKVISPTFILEKIYKLPKDNNFRFSNLIHIDAYRIESEEELNLLDLEKIIKNEDNILVIEWADKIEKKLPKESIKIYFKFIDEEKREVKW